jgi:hypothetical protein
MVREIQVVRLRGELGGQSIDLLHEGRHTARLAQCTHGQRVRTDAARNLGVGESVLLAAQECTYKSGRTTQATCQMPVLNCTPARCPMYSVFLTRRDILQRSAQEQLLHLLLDLNDVLELAQEPTGHKREEKISQISSLN